MKVLVTGGAGYLGSHLVKRLAASEFEPVVLDNLSTGHAWAVPAGMLEEADLAASQDIEAILQKHRVQAVIHLAGSATVGESMTHPQFYFRNNVTHTLNLLDAMLRLSVKRIVFASTCSTYGIPLSLPITEAHSQIPISPYGESKHLVERILKWYGVAYGLSSISFRIFNLAGADPDGAVGEAHAPETHLLPIILQSMLGQRGPMKIYGTDYPTPDGTAVRDYIHVMDASDAMVLALRSLMDGAGSRALNLGSGRGISIQEMIEAAEKMAGRSVPVSVADRKPGDPPELVADTVNLEQALGWSPRYSDLDTLVETALQWHRGHPQEPSTESR